MEPQPLAAVRLVGAPADSMDRVRLFRRLDRAVKRGTVLLHGPAGTGKSVLVYTWLIHRGHTMSSTRWLECTAETSSHAIARAFEALTGHEPVSGLQPVLVIDRLEQAPAGLPHEIMEIAVSHPGVRLVLCSRTWPAMRIGQLSARGDIAAIGPEEMAFTRDEVGHLRHLRRGSSDERSATRLWEFSHGWAVVVQIISDSPNAALDDLTLRALASFYAEEMLDQLTAEQLDATNAAAVTEWATSELLQRITGHPDTAPLLHEVIRLGLPISWDAYGRTLMHPTFRRHLLTMMALVDPDRLMTWRGRAAEWLEEQGHSMEALSLAVASGNEVLSMALVKQEFLRQLFSNTRQLRDVLAEMPTSWHARNWFIGVLHALAHAADTGTNLSTVLGVVAAHLPPADDAELTISLESLTVVAIRLAQSRMTAERPELALGLADALDAQVSGLSHQDRFGVRSGLSLFYCQYGETLLLAGRLNDAKQALVMAQASAQLAGLDWVELEATGGLAMVEALMGRAAVADRQADDAIEQARSLGLDTSTLVARAHLAKGLAAVLSDAGSGVAREALARYDACYLHQQHEFGGLRAYVETMMILARADAVGASAVVNAHRRTHLSATGALAEKMLNLAALTCFLAQEQYELAEAELVAFAAASTQVELAGVELVEARILLRRGRAAEAWAKVQLSLGSVGQLHPAPALVQLITAGLVAHQVGEYELEVALAARAAALAARTGLSVAVLRQVVLGYAPDRPNPLTEAERAVLASLSPDDTIATAAARMFVSVNTYKTHLRKAYRKLAVNSREAALTKARAVGWI